MSQPSIIYKQPKFIVFVGMLYITTIIASAILTSRVLLLNSIVMPGGILLFPLTYFFGDVVTEVYGYKVARQLLWFAIACEFIFSFMLQVTMSMPTPDFFSHEQSFKEVLDPVFRFFVSITAASIISGFANIYIISKWKILLRGKYFWLRSLGATTVGEFIFSIIALSAIFIGTMPAQKVWGIIMAAYFLKLIYGMLAVYPAALLARYLKRIENIDVYDKNTNFNPFALAL